MDEILDVHKNPDHRKPRQITHDEGYRFEEGQDIVQRRRGSPEGYHHHDDRQYERHCERPAEQDGHFAGRHDVRCNRRDECLTYQKHYEHYDKRHCGSHGHQISDPYDPRSMLHTVNKAIENVLVGGQSYRIGSRQLTRPDLALLKALKSEYEGAIAQEEYSPLMEDTYVAMWGSHR